MPTPSGWWSVAFRVKSHRGGSLRPDLMGHAFYRLARSRTSEVNSKKSGIGSSLTRHGCRAPSSVIGRSEYVKAQGADASIQSRNVPLFGEVALSRFRSPEKLTRVEDMPLDARGRRQI